MKSEEVSEEKKDYLVSDVGQLDKERKYNMIRIMWEKIAHTFVHAC